MICDEKRNSGRPPFNLTHLVTRPSGQLTLNVTPSDARVRGYVTKPALSIQTAPYRCVGMGCA